jgi:WD40 repeat protein
MSLLHTNRVAVIFLVCFVVPCARAADKPTTPREEDKLTDLMGEVTKITFGMDGKSLIAQMHYQPPWKPGYGIGGGGPGSPVTSFVAWNFTPRKVTKLNPVVLLNGGCLPSPHLHSMATWNPIGPDTMMQRFYDVDEEIKGAKPKAGKGQDALNIGQVAAPIPKADLSKAWKWLENTMEPLAFSPDGKVAVAKSIKDGAILLFDVDKDKRIAKIEMGGAKSLKIPGVVFSGDSNFVAVPSMDGSPVRVYRVAGGKEYGRAGKFYLGSVLSLSPDGTTLALGHTKSGDVQIWDVATGKLRDTWRTGGRAINDVAYSGDGKVLFAAVDRAIVVWDANAKREIARLRGHTAEVSVLVVSADGKHLASGGKDKSVRLWDIGAYAAASQTGSSQQTEARP